MDLGFTSREFLDELNAMQTQFAMRVKNNLNTELDRDRLGCDCDLESRSEFRLSANLWYASNEAIGEIYCQRWQIGIL